MFRYTFGVLFLGQGFKRGIYNILDNISYTFTGLESLSSNDVHLATEQAGTKIR